VVNDVDSASEYCLKQILVVEVVVISRDTSVSVMFLEAVLPGPDAASPPTQQKSTAI
jgi:hypothetical protein